MNESIQLSLSLILGIIGSMLIIVGLVKMLRHNSMMKLIQDNLINHKHWFYEDEQEIKTREINNAETLENKAEDSEKKRVPLSSLNYPHNTYIPSTMTPYGANFSIPSAIPISKFSTLNIIPQITKPDTGDDMRNQKDASVLSSSEHLLQEVQEETRKYYSSQTEQEQATAKTEQEKKRNDLENRVKDIEEKEKGSQSQQKTTSSTFQFGNCSFNNTKQGDKK